jgi:hypothetical protein
MARGHVIELSTQIFNTKGEATAFFKAMLNRYKPKDRVTDADALHLSALLERHPEYMDKVGCGIDHFEVMMSEWGTQCFRIVRTDGTGTDFSYTQSIDGRPPSRKREVSQAFRRAVQIDLYRARDDFLSKHKGGDGRVACGLTGERIAPEDGHIDHKPPHTFDVLVGLYLQAKGLDYQTVAITEGRDDQVAPELLDADLVKDFRRYHAKTATLEFVKDKANLAQSAKHRVRGGRIQIKRPL